ncbi:UvrD-helicase domain-containing protein [Saccharospirillum sp. HFRX-1]|uniref:UvrD-helicase domain-containing protein n=1 Tax=unclassified Saccharospirillum TaxID=2633430 RepID=UPI0037201348
MALLRHHPNGNSHPTMSQSSHSKTLVSKHPIRLFLSGKTTRFHRDGRHISIDHPGKQSRDVIAASLTDDQVLEQGLWFATLTLQTTQGRYTLKWLNKSQAQAVLHWLRSGWLKAIEQEVIDSAHSVRELLGQNYPRQSILDQAQQLATEASALFGQVPQKSWCQNLNLSAFRYVSRISQMNDDERPQVQQRYLQQQLEQYADYFDNVESMPLTRRQREACVINEENNLVLAGAGTGKTSVMIGRAGYLIASNQAKSADILMLAFGSDAAKEMQQRADKRLGKDEITAKTFHGLGLEIIKAVEGNNAPGLSELAEDEIKLNKRVDDWFEAHLKTRQYRKLVNRYFCYYLRPDINPFDFKTKGEYLEYVRANDLRTLQGELVKSLGELQIANSLYSQGINYSYEKRYKVDTATPGYRQYYPDFYLPDQDIYIEFYGINRQGKTPPFIDQQRYTDSMQWKKQTHEENGTQLIELFHYQRTEGTLEADLAKALELYNIEATPRPDEDLLETLRDLGDIKKIADLLKALLQRYRGNCYDLEKPAPTFNDPKDAALQAAMELLMPILADYEAELESTCSIDFNDMIGKAIQYIRDGKYQPKWRHILVDEFQDISEPRARLLQCLKDHGPDSSLFCVGDDWQAIYRFTGSDLNYTTHFEQHFGTTQTTSLDQTFRFNSSIGDIAARFITQNAKQIQKTLSSLTTVEQPAVSILKATRPTGKDNDPRLDTVLARLEQIAEPGSSVYLLARNKFTYPKKSDIKSLNRRYPSLTLSRDTIHKSKGREADYVVLLGLESGDYGLPSQMQENALIAALLPKMESYTYAEERRLFYVALTRAKHRVYLITDMTVTSEFIIELLDDNYPVETEEFDTSVSQKLFRMMKCIRCKTGSMVYRRNSYRCTNEPLCNHTETACLTCKSQMYRQGRFRLCTNANCKSWVPTCPKCASDLKQRTGPYGEFWGCSQYGDKEMPCNHTEQHIEYNVNGGEAGEPTF